MSPMASRADSMRPATRSLNSRLIWRTLGTLLPMVVFASVVAVVLVRQERASVEQGARDRVRALSTALDSELRSSVEPLLALAQSEALLGDDLSGFRKIALRVKQGRPDWLTMNVAVPSGHQILNLLQPEGAPPVPVGDRSSFDAVLAGRAPAVGNLGRGPVSGKLDIAVRVPVMRDGEVRYVLSAILEPAAIQRLLDAQRFPEEQTAVIFDRNGRIVARSKAQSTTLGQPVSKTLQEVIAQRQTGAFETVTLEGVPVHSTFMRSDSSGWGVATGIPTSRIAAAGWWAAAAMTIGTLVALLFALFIAWLLGRRISGPMADLARQAGALIEGRTSVPVAPSGVTEIDALSHAFARAGDAVRSRETVQRQFAVVTDNASLALFMMDERRHCTFMNPAAEEMTGFRLEEMQGRPLHDLIHHSRPDGSPYPAEECPIHGALRSEHRRHGEDVFVHRSGRYFPIAFTASPIRGRGAALGTVVEVRDISEEQQLERERQVLLASEQKARGEAEAANRAKDEFLAMLGHELRNPLGAIGNASYLLRLGPDTSKVRSLIEIIQRQVKHLTRLVDDLLDAGRVTTGKIALVRERVDLGELVRRITEGLVSSGATARHEIEVDTASVWVEGDETRLEQVTNNLLANALRYTPPGGRIWVTVRAEGEDAVLTVRDSGVGIDAELLPRVFDLFVQGPRTAERAAGGLGIGLTLVKRLVELQGGSVAAESAGPCEGSRFTVRLPRSAAPMNRAASVEAGKGSSGRKLRVLVIEDTDDVREPLCEALREAGHEVRECSDGPTGVQEALNWRPDLALVDIGLPGLDGHEVARRIRAGAPDAPIHLIAVTGYGMPEDERKSRAAGFDRHAVKPIDPSELLSWLADSPSPYLADSRPALSTSQATHTSPG